jgi:hypothetical protein
MGEGLQRVCKMYGGMTIQGEKWVWDYARDIPVRKADMTHEQLVQSERAKYAAIKEAGGVDGDDPLTTASTTTEIPQSNGETK